EVSLQTSSSGPVGAAGSASSVFFLLLGAATVTGCWLTTDLCIKPVWPETSTRHHLPSSDSPVACTSVLVFSLVTSAALGSGWVRTCPPLLAKTVESCATKVIAAGAAAA